MVDSTDQGTDDKVVAGPTKLAGSTPSTVEKERTPASTTADERVATQPREVEKEGVEKQASEGKGDKSCSKLPDERRLWKFLEGVKGWRFTGSGWTVCGPEGGGGSGSSMEAAELPQYVVSQPSLLAEYEWQQRQADGHEQEKPQESTRPQEKPQDKGVEAVVEKKGEQTLASKDREQAQEGDVQGPEEGDMVGPDNGKETPHQGAAMEVEGEAEVEEVEVVVGGKGEVQEAREANMEVDGEAGLKETQGEKAVGGDVGGTSEERSGVAVEPVGAGAAAAAAASGDVAGAGGGGAGAAPKSKAKGDGKQGTAFGPCMCPQGTDGAHKTVDVERRCWPGSNKPGGIGRITKKYTAEEEVCGEMVQMSYFDIKYLLGGSEKRVQETYISCTPLEIAARQSAPRDRFTVEVPEPTTRRQKPARTPPPPAPTRTSPLASSADANTSLSSLEAKAKGSRSLKKVTPVVKRSKPTIAAAAAAAAGGREGKGPRKRARTAEGGGRPWKKASSQSECKENQEVHREREVPARGEDPTRHAITDLSVVVEATKTPSAPLSAGRMDAFQLALGALFRQSTTDTISLAKVHADINAQVVQGTSPFNDNEVTLSLKYLEDVESKVMLDSGMLYRI
ncbi:hypothetical protein Esi_0162_0021 [Ectocarpus siliculosus]|uniref:MCM3-like winged helix domain-containing protein n=1 Tax=Ectocarpus siliculosus TaxID=2880 RepID=D7FLY1_ECTSI|nr:hypothetical protein Esi_0162_0021 [Ectocarpus siliculosus]|eukprot:CBJ29806.1 hypothetical protein Esi_0162_0021 [Ectocarpus siliculosus]